MRVVTGRGENPTQGRRSTCCWQRVDSRSVIAMSENTPTNPHDSEPQGAEFLESQTPEETPESDRSIGAAAIVNAPPTSEISEGSDIGEADDSPQVPLATEAGQFRTAPMDLEVPFSRGAAHPSQQSDAAVHAGLPPDSSDERELPAGVLAANTLPAGANTAGTSAAANPGIPTHSCAPPDPAVSNTPPQRHPAAARRSPAARLPAAHLPPTIPSKATSPTRVRTSGPDPTGRCRWDRCNRCSHLGGRSRRRRTSHTHL